MTSIGNAIKLVFNSISERSCSGVISAPFRHIMRPGMTLNEYVEAVRARPIVDSARNVIGRFPESILTDHSRALLAAANNILNTPTCIGVRPEGNSKHSLIISRGSKAIDACASWALKGAHVSLLLTDTTDLAIGEYVDAFALEHISRSDLETLVQAADMTIEADQDRTGVDIPELLSNVRLFRPIVESKLSFDLSDAQDEKAVEVLDFLRDISGRTAEKLVHEFLEVCHAFQERSLAAKPIHICFEGKSALREAVVVHAAVASLNPFSRAERANTISVSGDVDESVRRFIRFAESRLGFAVINSDSSTDGALVVRGSAGVVNDPFRLASQHLLRSQSPAAYKWREYEVIKCKPVEDNSIV